MGSPTSNPQVSMSLLPAALVTAFADRRDIIFGQTGAAGTATDAALNSDVEGMTTAEIKTLFGSTSYLTNCILDWKTSNGGYSPLDVIGLDAAGGGTAATGVITVVGTATSAGEYLISIVDEEKYQVTVDIPDTSTETQAALAIKTACDLLTDAVFTSGVLAGVYTATATDVGTIGNNYGIKIEGVVPGLATTITAWTGGATDPTLTSILDNIAGIRYTGMVWPEAWYSSISIPTIEMESRFNPANAIMDGTVFTGMTQTYADNLVSMGLVNSQTVCTMGSPLLAVAASHMGPAVLQPADWAASSFAGIRAKRLTPNAPISSQIISTGGALDSIGGAQSASLPYFNTPMPLMPVTASTNMFSNTEQLALEAAGFTTYGPNSAQNAMVMGAVRTNWTTDAGGNANLSFAYLNYTDTGSVCREVFFRANKSNYAQSRLTEGDLIAQMSIANAESIKAFNLRIYKSLSVIALTQAGAEAEGFYAQNTSVTIDLSTGAVTMAGPLPIVTQLRSITYPLQLAFTVAGTGTQITI